MQDYELSKDKIPTGYAFLVFDALHSRIEARFVTMVDGRGQFFLHQMTAQPAPDQF